MKSNFEAAMAKVFVHEGGYSDHPNDTGGATKYGVTIGVLSAWRGHKVSKDDVRKLTKTEAKKIFKTRYWDPLSCDDIPKGPDYAVYDFGVNSGISRSAQYVQRIVGVAADGRIGPVTIAAIKAYPDKRLINDLMDRREDFLRAIIRNRPSQKVFSKGWFRRTDEVRRDALAMLDTPKPKPTPKPTPKPKKAAEPQRVSVWQRIKSWWS